ncbi:MAG TPA: helix-turn-helix domain-containing protein [Chitinophagaceae bacterium]
MHTRFYIPHPLLQDLIQCIMVIDVQVDASAGPVVVPYPPTPQNSLFFYIDDPIQVLFDDNRGFVLQPHSVIVGPQLTPVKIDINQHHKAVRIGFHPGGLHRLLGLSLHEMVDGNYNAADVFGNVMERVHQQLQEAEGFDAIKNVAEQFLLEQLQRTRPVLPFDLAMLQLLKHQGNKPIEEIASLSCLSLRQFERVCRQRIGLPPKLFARITRFSKAYRLRENFPFMRWTAIAYECGYFDQMHFIRDFKEFAGVAPGIITKELEQLPVRLQGSMRL